MKLKIKKTLRMRKKRKEAKNSFYMKLMKINTANSVIISSKSNSN